MLVCMPNLAGIMHMVLKLQQAYMAGEQAWHANEGYLYIDSMLVSKLLQSRYIPHTVPCMLSGSTQVLLQGRQGPVGCNLPQVCCMQLRLQL